jgi:poly-gamma-glutamate synthesis protein (capsule biosynthesis protein)
MPTKPTIMLAFCGDVMTGRGIDQVLPHPSEPHLYEPALKSAVDYVALAETAHGPIRPPVRFDYIWGDVLDTIRAVRPDAWIINLETAVTRAGDPWPKGINYRMSPDNVPCLTAANIDCCVLANNHVLDWGRDGLLETLQVLDRAGLKTAGAGRNLEEASAPAILKLPDDSRALVYAFACPSSGVPDEWAATAYQPGVNLLGDGYEAAIDRLAARMARERRAHDVAVCSLHWGPNWGYGIPSWERSLARGLIDRTGVDIVFGHSSHHPKAIEVRRGKPIFYGCGDFLNDYEGIEGYEEYRGDLVLMYIAELNAADRRLTRLEMIPFRIRNFRLNRATAEEMGWLARRMDRECRRFGSRVNIDERGRLTVVQPRCPSRSFR